MKKKCKMDIKMNILNQKTNQNSASKEIVEELW